MRALACLLLVSCVVAPDDSVEIVDTGAVASRGCGPDLVLTVSPPVNEVDLLWAVSDVWALVAPGDTRALRADCDDYGCTVVVHDPDCEG